MRFVYTLFVSLSLCPFLHAAPTDSVCWINVALPNDEFQRGSGTVIACENGNSLIMTCAHIVENGDGKITIWINEKTYDATYLTGTKVIITEDNIKIEGIDVAFIVVKATLPVSPFAKVKGKVGDKVRQWGFAGGQTTYGPYYKEGKIIGLKDIHTTADARPGDSGAALFNDKDEVIGIINSRSADLKAVGGYGYHVEEITAYIVSSDKLVGFDKFKKTLKEK